MSRFTYSLLDEQPCVWDCCACLHILIRWRHCCDASSRLAAVVGIHLHVMALITCDFATGLSLALLCMLTGMTCLHLGCRQFAGINALVYFSTSVFRQVRAVHT